MDKNALSEYGWIVIVIILLALIIAFLPALGGLITGGTHEYADDLFGTQSGNNRLPKPSLLVKSNTLIIVDSSSLIEEYEITIDTEAAKTVASQGPETKYDLSDLADGVHPITVVGKAEGYEDSPPAKTTVTIYGGAVKPGSLSSPLLSIENTSLIITKVSHETKSYEIIIDGSSVGTVEAQHLTTEYDVSQISAGIHTIEVIAKASGYEDSPPATIDAKKLSPPQINGDIVNPTSPESEKYVSVLSSDVYFAAPQTTICDVIVNKPLQDFYDEHGVSNDNEDAYEHKIKARADGWIDSDWVVREFTIVKEHVHSYGEWEDGGSEYHIRYCSCGSSQNSSHRYDYYEYSDAEHVLYCEDCKRTIYNPHSLTYTQYNASYHTVNCRLCAYSDKMAHEFAYRNNGDGTHSYFCMRCGYIKTTEPHDIDDNGYCVCGFRGDPHTHNYVWEYNATKHWKECTCGTKTNEGNHTFGDWVVDQEATCSKEGSKSRTCSQCGYQEIQEIDTTAHDFTASCGSVHSCEFTATCYRGSTPIATHMWTSYSCVTCSNCGTPSGYRWCGEHGGSHPTATNGSHS